MGQEAVGGALVAHHGVCVLGQRQRLYRGGIGGCQRGIAVVVDISDGARRARGCQSHGKDELAPSAVEYDLTGRGVEPREQSVATFGIPDEELSVAVRDDVVRNNLCVVVHTVGPPQIGIRGTGLHARGGHYEPMVLTRDIVFVVARRPHHERHVVLPRSRDGERGICIREGRLRRARGIRGGIILRIKLITHLCL